MADDSCSPPQYDTIGDVPTSSLECEQLSRQQTDLEYSSEKRNAQVDDSVTKTLGSPNRSNLIQNLVEASANLMDIDFFWDCEENQSKSEVCCSGNVSGGHKTPQESSSGNGHQSCYKAHKESSDPGTHANIPETELVCEKCEETEFVVITEEEDCHDCEADNFAITVDIEEIEFRSEDSLSKETIYDEVVSPAASYTVMDDDACPEPIRLVANTCVEPRAIKYCWVDDLEEDNLCPESSYIETVGLRATKEAQEENQQSDWESLFPVETAETKIIPCSQEKDWEAEEVDEGEKEPRLDPIESVETENVHVEDRQPEQGTVEFKDTSYYSDGDCKTGFKSDNTVIFEDVGIPYSEDENRQPESEECSSDPAITADIQTTEHPQEDTETEVDKSNPSLTEAKQSWEEVEEASAPGVQTPGRKCLWGEEEETDPEGLNSIPEKMNEILNNKYSSEEKVDFPLREDQEDEIQDNISDKISSVGEMEVTMEENERMDSLDPSKEVQNNECNWYYDELTEDMAYVEDNTVTSQPEEIDHFHNYTRCEINRASPEPDENEHHHSYTACEIRGLKRKTIAEDTKEVEFPDNETVVINMPLFPTGEDIQTEIQELRLSEVDPTVVHSTVSADSFEGFTQTDVSSSNTSMPLISNKLSSSCEAKSSSAEHSLLAKLLQNLTIETDESKLMKLEEPVRDMYTFLHGNDEINPELQLTELTEDPMEEFDRNKNVKLQEIEESQQGRELEHAFPTIDDHISTNHEEPIHNSDLNGPDICYQVVVHSNPSINCDPELCTEQQPESDCLKQTPVNESPAELRMTSSSKELKEGRKMVEDNCEEEELQSRGGQSVKHEVHSQLNLPESRSQYEQSTVSNNFKHKDSECGDHKATSCQFKLHPSVLDYQPNKSQTVLGMYEGREFKENKCSLLPLANCEEVNGNESENNTEPETEIADYESRKIEYSAESLRTAVIVAQKTESNILNIINALMIAQEKKSNSRKRNKVLDKNEELVEHSESCDSYSRIKDHNPESHETEFQSNSLHDRNEHSAQHNLLSDIQNSMNDCDKFPSREREVQGDIVSSEIANNSEILEDMTNNSTDNTVPEKGETLGDDKITEDGEISCVEQELEPHLDENSMIDEQDGEVQESRGIVEGHLESPVIYVEQAVEAMERLVQEVNETDPTGEEPGNDTAAREGIINHMVDFLGEIRQEGNETASQGTESQSEDLIEFDEILNQQVLECHKNEINCLQFHAETNPESVDLSVGSDSQSYQEGIDIIDEDGSFSHEMDEANSEEAGTEDLSPEPSVLEEDEGIMETSDFTIGYEQQVGETESVADIPKEREMDATCDIDCSECDTSQPPVLEEDEGIMETLSFTTGYEQEDEETESDADIPKEPEMDATCDINCSECDTTPEETSEEAIEMAERQLPSEDEM